LFISIVEMYSGILIHVPVLIQKSTRKKNMSRPVKIWETWPLGNRLFPPSWTKLEQRKQRNYNSPYT